MITIPATFIAVAGTTFLLASYTNHSATPPSLSSPHKGDRLVSSSSTGRVQAGEVEFVALDNGAIVLRRRNGSVVYRSDPASSTTVVAKDVVIPSVEVPVVARTPAAREPGRAQDGGERPEDVTQRRKRTVGCESALSPLVRASAEIGPSRCLA